MAKKEASTKDSKQPTGSQEKKTVAGKNADTKTTSRSIFERRGMRTVLVWLGVAILISGIYYLTHRETITDIEGARSASNQLIDDFQAGDCSEMYAATTEGFQSRSTEENWNSQCAVASDVLQGEPETLSTQDNNTEDDAVQFSYRIQGTDDQAYIITTVMLHRDGQWLLDGLSSRVEESQATPEAQ